MSKAISLYIVEDDKLTRKNYNILFSQIEQEISLLGDFETAEECIKNIKTFPADVVLMDIGLPRMNGIEATKLIKRKSPKTKVVMMTSHDRDEEIIAALASGANGYTLKDIEFNTLVTAIKEINKGAVWIDPRMAPAALASFPKPETTDLENLYIKKKLRKRLRITFTEREIAILKLMKDGKTNPEIGRILYISENTVKANIKTIMRKLSVNDRTQAVVKAAEYGII